MQEQHPTPDDWITGYLDGTLTPQEEKELGKWILADDSHKKYYYEMTEIALAAQASDNKSGEKAFERFLRRTGQSVQVPVRTLRPYLQIAASLLIGVFLGITGLYLFNRDHFSTSATAMQTIEVPYGSKSRVILADGTKVWLNAGSKFSCPGNFTGKNREVQLQGEGYFEVTRNPQRPFLVNTREIGVQVLGTKFNIKAYTGEKFATVTLAEGSIHFINKFQPDSSFTMKPGEQAVFNTDTRHTLLQKTSPEQACGWITGAHFFNELTFEEIANRLEKTYDVTFIFKNSKQKELVFYGKFKPDETLDDILYIMSGSKKFTYKKTDNVIEIY